jgi:hypothetical protein
MIQIMGAQAVICDCDQTLFYFSPAEIAGREAQGQRACLFFDDLIENMAATRLVGMHAYQIGGSLPVDGLAVARISTLDTLIGPLLPPSARD